MNKNIRQRILASVLIIIITILFSCKSNYNVRMRQAEEQFYIQNKSLEAARELLPGVNAGGTDGMLYMLEAGVMLHAGGEYRKSTDVLLKAAKVMDNLPISVSQQAESLLLNDTHTNYRGEDFERVLVHMYLGMNYLYMKKPDEAQVEFRRVGNELKRIEIETGKTYKQNIMAKYLTAVAFEIAAELADNEKERYDNYEYALVEYKQIKQLAPGLSLVNSDLERVPKLMEDSKGKKTLGQLVMIFQGGRSPYKVSRGKLVSDRTMNNLLTTELQTGLSNNPALGLTAATITASLNKAENPIPKFERRSNFIKKLRIKAGKKAFETNVLEDITGTSLRAFEDDYDFYRQKVAAGIAAKVVASLVATYTAKEASKLAGGALQQLGGNWANVGKVLSSGNEAIGAAAGIGTAAALISQIKPDLRCWHALPASFQLGRIFLPAGEYKVEVQLIDKNNNVHKVEKESITIKAGETTMLNYRTLY